MCFMSKHKNIVTNMRNATNWENVPLPMFLQLQKMKNTYNLLQFPAEMNTRGSKTPTTFNPFLHKLCCAIRTTKNKTLLDSCSSVSN